MNIKRKYRKKPVIIEAYQTDEELLIHTLEGDLLASVGDYIITGINGEQYPCKPDIFEKTYEIVQLVWIWDTNYFGSGAIPYFKRNAKHIESTKGVMCSMKFDQDCARSVMQYVNKVLTQRKRVGFPDAPFGQIWRPTFLRTTLMRYSALLH